MRDGLRKTGIARELRQWADPPVIGNKPPNGPGVAGTNSKGEVVAANVQIQNVVAMWLASNYPRVATRARALLEKWQLAVAEERIKEGQHGGNDKASRTNMAGDHGSAKRGSRRTSTGTEVIVLSD